MSVVRFSPRPSRGRSSIGLAPNGRAARCRTIDCEMNARVAKLMAQGLVLDIIERDHRAAYGTTLFAKTLSRTIGAVERSRIDFTG